MKRQVICTLFFAIVFALDF